MLVFMHVKMIVYCSEMNLIRRINVLSVKLQGGNQKRRVLMGKGYIELLERFFAIFLLKEGFKGTLCPLKLQLT